MGRGRIISGGSGGLYTIEAIHARARIDAEIGRLNALIDDLDGQIIETQDELDAATIERQEAQEALDDIIREYSQARQAAINAGEPIPPSPDFSPLVRALIRARAAESSVQSALAVLRARRMSANKRRQALQAVPEDQAQPAWCADYTEDLSGVVGTVEVPAEAQPGETEVSRRIQIRPGFEGLAAYDSPRDGILFHREGQSPEQVYLNAALMPGVQRWRPQYRIGTITSIDREEDTCRLTLQSEESSAQSLIIDPPDLQYQFEDVPIVYMSCHAEAFEEGDRVLIEFPDRDWSQPRVIGFEKEPRPCGTPCVLLAASRFSGGWLREALIVTPRADEVLAPDATPIITEGHSVGDPWSRARIDSVGSDVWSGASWGNATSFGAGVYYKISLNGQDTINLGPVFGADFLGNDWSVDSNYLWFLSKQYPDETDSPVRSTRVHQLTLAGSVIQHQTISDFTADPGWDGGQNTGFRVRNGIAAYGVELAPEPSLATANVDTWYGSLDQIAGDTTVCVHQDVYTMSNVWPPREALMFEHYNAPGCGPGGNPAERLYTVYMNSMDVADGVQSVQFRAMPPLIDGEFTGVSDDPAYGGLLLFRGFEDVGVQNTRGILSVNGDTVTFNWPFARAHAVVVRLLDANGNFNPVVLRKVFSSSIPQRRAFFDTNQNKWVSTTVADPDYGLYASRVELDRSGRSMLFVTSSISQSAWDNAESPQTIWGEHPMLARVIDVETGDEEIRIPIPGPPAAELEIHEALLTSQYVYLRYLVQIEGGPSMMTRIYDRATGDSVYNAPLLLGGNSMLIDLADVPDELQGE